MNHRRLPIGSIMAAHEFAQLMFKLRVPVKPGTIITLIECTYCGGPHSRSECKWPLARRA